MGQENREIAQNFYIAFVNKDIDSLRQYYSENITFNDPAFGTLKGVDVMSMWEMLFQNGKDLDVRFEIKGEEGDVVLVKWIANYTFSRTKRQVENHVTARLKFSEGKIIIHTDDFDFYSWSKQALGGIGVLLGWTKWFQRKFNQEAVQSLHKFIESKPKR